MLDLHITHGLRNDVSSIIDLSISDHYFLFYSLHCYHILALLLSRLLGNTIFYHLRNFAKVQPFLPQADTERLKHAFITSRLDHCNALLSSLPRKAINKLQIIDNAAACVLTNTRRRAHISPVLKSLHWLTVNFRIDFKVILLVFKSLSGLAPEYLSDMLLKYAPFRSLSSSGTSLLVARWARTKNYRGVAFSVYGPHHNLTTV